MTGRGAQVQEQRAWWRCLNRYRFGDRATARRAVFAWINRYNTRRLHSSLGSFPPLEWENQYRQLKADQAA